MKIKGTVVHGRGVGKTLGFPTANIKATIPQHVTPGVYCAEIIFNNERLPSVVNIGACPTFSVTERTIEAHIINFSKDLYGKDIELNVKNKIRDIKKFDNTEALKEQINADINFCLKNF